MTKRILAVDDEPHILRLIEVNLGRAGYEVLTAPDGRAGLEAALAARPDLIVMDAMMPFMDGFEMLAQLKRMEETRGIPVIMLSAKRHDADVFRGWECGVNCYLTKPFNPAELSAMVQRILETACPRPASPRQSHHPASRLAASNPGSGSPPPILLAQAPRGRR